MKNAIQLVASIPLLGAMTQWVLFIAPQVQLLHEWLVIAASLTPYGIPMAATALALLAIARAPRTALALALVVLVIHMLVARPYWPRSSPAPSSTITVMTMNMRCDEPGDADLLQLLRAQGPAVAVVNGLSELSRSVLTEALTDQYATAAFSPMPGYPECGTVVFTDLPFDGWVATQQQPTALVRTPGFAFALVAVDMPTPNRGIGPWVESFDQLIADSSGLAGRSVVAVGDFNAVLEHEPMRRLMRETGLRDAVTASGLGWLPTFPDDGRLPALVALDHALLSPGLVATAAWTESVAGQGHRALFVRVGVAE